MHSCRISVVGEFDYKFKEQIRENLGRLTPSNLSTYPYIAPPETERLLLTTERQDKKQHGRQLRNGRVQVWTHLQSRRPP